MSETNAFSDSGKFQPDKWLEHRWECEGTANRSNVNVKRKEKLKTETLADESTVLSPQRRGFSLGCRAQTPARLGKQTLCSLSSMYRWVCNVDRMIIR